VDDEKVEELFTQMRSQGVEASVVTYNAVMSAAVKSGGWQQAGGTAFSQQFPLA
jgi:hypothetical protein